MKFIQHPLAWAVSAVLAAPVFGETLELESSTISASPLARSLERMTSPAAVLEGDELTRRSQATLGGTLDSLPGVRGSSFGAGASRPLIRGLDGARVKVLSDGADVLDASTISADHAVTSEPLLAERIEVLKGPATLLYGGGAIGGVVNVIDRKVPTRVPEKGYEGQLEWRGNTVANESAGLFGITAGSGNFAVRVEGLKRNANEYEIPGKAGEPRSDKQTGAYNDTETATLGASWIGERGYLGLAFTRQANQYGLLGHEHADCHTHTHGTEVEWHCGAHGHGGGHSHDDEGEGVPYIDMEQRRWDLRGEYSEPLAGFESGRLRIGYSDYEHREIEGGETATTFKNKASDARFELTHKPLFGWHGVLGAQTTRRDFEALGEEAYVPPTLTHNHALFLLEEYTLGDWRYELGLRHEWQDIDVRGGQPDTDHRGTSVSAGAVWTFAPEYSLGFSLSRSQRLPTAEELYANGPHAASRTIELGNPDLDEETSYNADITLRKFLGRTTFSLSLFRNQVDDFIYAADTGHAPGGGYREIEYLQHDAVLTGAEGEVRFQASESFAVTLFGDHVRGKLRHGGGDLPRIPSDRLGARLEQAFSEALDGQLEFYRVQRQGKHADYEDSTAGYNMLGASLGYRGTLQQAEYLVYLRGDNLLDAKAREHTSLIKDDVLLPGRNLSLGVRLSF